MAWPVAIITRVMSLPNTACNTIVKHIHVPKNIIVKISRVEYIQYICCIKDIRPRAVVSSLCSEVLEAKDS